MPHFDVLGNYTIKKLADSLDQTKKIDSQKHFRRGHLYQGNEGFFQKAIESYYFKIASDKERSGKLAVP